MRKVLFGVGLGVGAAAIILLLGWDGALDRVEMMAYDWRMRVVADPSKVHPDIVLVEINDTSILAFADAVGRWPWPRVLQSEVIDFLKRGGARVIAYDLQLSEPSRGSFMFGDVTWTADESDAAMVASVRSAGNVIMLADATNPGLTADPTSPDAAAAHAAAISRWHSPAYRLGPAIEERPVVVPPFQRLSDAAAGLGHNFLALDQDGPARRIAPFIRSGDRYLPSLGVAAAIAAGGFKPGEVVLEGRTLRVRDRRIPLVAVPVQDSPGSRTTHDQLTMLINYRAPALQPDGARPYPSYEARHLVLSEEQIVAGMKPDLDPAVFADKIVFVGLTASGLVDVFPTPFGSQGTMPGIQLHASVADSILSGAFIRPAPEGSRIAATIVTAVLVGLMAAILPFVVAAIGSALAAAAWTSLCLWAFRRGLWLNMIQPVAATGVALFAGTAYRYFVEDREKRVVKKLFGRYVSRDVFDQLTAHPELAELGGKRREMTVLFSDIRGFTSVTEKGNPEELVAQLNEYFSRMVEIVFRHKGTVDKFVGDMVMALFGAPLDDPNHADHAVQASIDMVRELAVLNKSWAERGMPQLDIGVGINSGDMIAGNIGSSSIMSYTVIGDNVNLGARLESLNKDYRTRIIMSDATRTRLTKVYESRPLGDVTVKGKSRAVAIYEIIVPAPFATSEEHK